MKISFPFGRNFFEQALGDSSQLKLLNNLSRVQLLIMDDLLLTPLSKWEGRDILEVIEGHYNAGATIIASQCPIEDWYPAIGDPTLADAICDRLLHNPYRLELRGDSMRRKDGGPVKTEDKARLLLKRKDRVR